MTRRLLLRRSAFVVLGLGAVALLLGLFHRPLLSAAASLWIVNEPEFQRVDAAIVTGGGLETRPFGAAELFKQGRTARIVTFRVQIQPTEAMGLRRPEHELALNIFEKLGVPLDAIAIIGEGVSSTWDEVQATREWCLREKITSIAVPTEEFHTRRVRWAFEKGLHDTGVEVHLVPLKAIGYSAENWWLDERGLLAFQNEIVKYIYYRLRH